MKIARLLVAVAVLSPLPASAAVTFTGAFAVPGNSTDLSGLSSSFASNRLSFGSDLTYDAATNTFYGITDRGPGGGVLPFVPRLNTFRLSTNSATNAISGFTLLSTTLFRDSDGVGFNGLNPTLLGGDPSVLGKSFDPEGIARLSNGHYLVSDEYGPSVYEFDANGHKLRAFTPPANILPREADGDANYTDGRPTITRGRQDNRGFEGLTVSNDGTKAYAILQDPLVNEGAGNDGRVSRNLRIVEYDIASGTSTAQYVYQLDSVADINSRVPGQPFSATDQGRSIGASSITALPDGTFLIIERDNRGLGTVDPTGAGQVGIKRVYRINLNGATNVADISLAGSNSLPAGVVPVSKSLFVDIQAALGFDAVEKLEGLAFGPLLADGSYSMFITSDNDFSVTQDGVGTQFDVCSPGDGGTGATQVPLGSPCPTGTSLLPSMIYGFKVTRDEIGAVPEPQTWATMVLGLGVTGAFMRRKRRVVSAV